MDTIGIDLHKRESQVCILTAEVELLERRIATTRERLRLSWGRARRAGCCSRRRRRASGWRGTSRRWGTR